jgi:hypothetical protein
MSTMSAPALNNLSTSSGHDDGSDYGDFSDGEQEIINQLLDNLTAADGAEQKRLNQSLLREDVEEADGTTPTRLLVSPRKLGKEVYIPQRPATSEQTGDQIPFYGSTTTGK